MTNSEYHDDRSHISSSGLKLIRSNPEEYFNKYVLNIKQKSSGALDVGTFFHSLVLEPETINDEFVYCDQTRYTKAFHQLKRENPGKIILDKNDSKMGIELAKVAKNSKLLTSLLQGGMAEASIFNNLHDIDQKVRLDYLVPASHILDLKSTKYPLSEMTIRRIIDQSDYDLSAVMYMNVWNSMVPEEDKIKDYYLAFVSKETFQVVIKKLSELEIERGQQKYEEAIFFLKEYRNSDKLTVLDEEKVLI
jgi:hypothetical protein